MWLLLLCALARCSLHAGRCGCHSHTLTRHPPSLAWCASLRAIIFCRRAAQVTEVEKEQAGADAGIRLGDEIVAVCGTDVRGKTLPELAGIVAERVESEPKMVAFALLRRGSAVKGSGKAGGASASLRVPASPGSPALAQPSGPAATADSANVAGQLIATAAQVFQEQLRAANP